MKRLMTLVVLVCFMMLAACSDGKESDVVAPDSETGGDEEQVTEDTAPTEEEETEDTSEDTNTDVTVEKSDQTPAPNNVVGILIKSAEVMADVFSFEVSGEIVEDYIFPGVKGYEEETLTMRMVLQGEPMMHMISSETEMYVVGDEFYVYDFDDRIWYYLVASSDDENWMFYEMSNPLGPEQLDDYISINEFFEVTDKGDHYLLSFYGDGDEFQAFATGVDIIEIDEWILNWDQSMSGWWQYELLIDKNTYHMIGYNLEYDLSDGSSHLHYKANYRHSNYNGFDEIIVPEDVKDSAVWMGF